MEILTLESIIFLSHNQDLNDTLANTCNKDFEKQKVKKILLYLHIIFVTILNYLKLQTVMINVIVLMENL